MSELWDAEAATFDDEPDHGLRDPETRAAWLELLTAHLPPAPARIADLGCGTGTLSVLLADAGYAVDGVDFSPAMVARARAKAAGRDGVTFVVADAGDAAARAGRLRRRAVPARAVGAARPGRGARALGRAARGRAARLLLVEGSWHTGAGLTATRDRGAGASGGSRRPRRTASTTRSCWGGPITDERYLVVGLSRPRRSRSSPSPPRWRPCRPRGRARRRRPGSSARRSGSRRRPARPAPSPRRA